MDQNSKLHFAPLTGSVQVQENTPKLLHMFDLRVQLYACKSLDEKQSTRYLKT